MKIYLPTSSENARRRVQIFDVVAMLIAAPLAFLLRDPGVMSDHRFPGALLYCIIGFASGVVMLIVFDLGRGLARYTSMRDAFAIAQAALATVATASMSIFTFTRLGDVSRSIPALHFLVLTSLMIGFRVIATARRERRYRGRTPENQEHVVVIGANRLAWFYLRMVDTLTQGRTRIVCVLDASPRFQGRSLYGRPVLAGPSSLQRIVQEYAVHGVKISRVMIASGRDSMPAEQWDELEACCRAENLTASFLPEALGLDIEALEPANSARPRDAAAAHQGYRLVKRGFDVLLSAALLFVLSPVLALLVVALLIDVGWPIIFWQQRIGFRGRPLLVYKLRTLHAPFDRHGNFVAEEDRTSRFGNLLRRLRLDELPQLWNVLTGEMSFVGPRPLLAEDQPATSANRLSVLPGITGWAQIHGGQLVGKDLKGELDEWYVQNLSLWLDLKIIMRTIWTVIGGDRSADSGNAANDSVAIDLDDAAKSPSK